MKFSRLMRQSLLVGLVVSSTAGAASGWEFLTSLVSPNESLPVQQDAIGVEFTPRGESLFRNRFEHLITSAGISVRDGYFPTVDQESHDPIKLDEIAKTNPEMGKFVAQIRGILQEWFVGLEIKDPLLAIHLKQAGYHIDFTKLALIPDPDLLAQMNLRDGAAFRIEAEFSGLIGGADALAVEDKANDYLGSFGLSPLTFDIKPKNPAVLGRISIPFAIQLGDEKERLVQMAPIRTNLQDLDLGLTYGNLTTPQITVSINGRNFPLNPDRLKRLVDENLAQLMESAKKGLGEGLKTFVPQYVQTALTSALTTSKLTQVVALPPPARPDGSKDPDFQFAIQPGHLEFVNRRLHVGVNASIIDTKRPRYAIVRSDNAASNSLQLGQIPEDKYDLMLTVDRGVLNRIMRLAYNRGYFNSMPIDPKNNLKLLEVPTIDPAPPVAGRPTDRIPYLRVHIVTEQAVTGLKTTLVSSPAKVSFDVIAKLLPSKDPNKPGMVVTLDSIDLQSSHVDDDSVTLLGSLFRGSIESGVRDELAKRSKDWARTQPTIGGPLPVPPQLFGIQLENVLSRFDPSGQLVMFLRYGVQK